ncbi:MAG: ABC transporter substrate-binding protein [Granulosicoccus sp.]
MRKRFIGCVCSAMAMCGIFSVPTLAQSSDRPTCLYVSSYHVGYEWSDGVERGLKDRLAEQCNITAFYMDTKRKKSTENKVAAGNAAYELIQDTNPDVVITSDDNAAKYLIVPHLVGAELPVVFSGINWTVEEYGLPASNITGIVEIAPIKPMLTEGMLASKLPSDHPTRVAYLGASTLSEIKNHNRVKSIAEKLDITVDRILAENFDDWKQGYLLAQDYDMVVMGSYSGIAQFDLEAASSWVLENTDKLSMTNHDWMMPVSAIGYTKVPEEHGEWAADSAIAILNGVRAVDIPLVTNRRWDTWINEPLLEAAGVNLNQSTLINAKKHK